MPDPTDVPLIYTTLGNIPVADTVESAHWSGDENTVVCAIEHHLKATGELVKRSVHVYVRKGLSVAGETGTIGG